MSDLPDTITPDPTIPASANRTVRTVLGGLGIHGWERIETQLLACVMSGEAVCMVSEPGSAKTYFGEVLSSALGLSYGYYDLSKAVFEGVLGYPSPAAFQEGREEYIATPLTIWDKEVIMVDEVSRAAKRPELTDKFLEVLGSRKLMGRPLPYKVAIGGMNPIDHAGTNPLDEAFADRFLLFIRLPQFTKMEQQTREAILGGKTGLDAPSVDFWAEQQTTSEGEGQPFQTVIVDDRFREASDQLRELLRDAALHYRALEASEFAEQTSRYVDLFARQLKEAQPPTFLEPRRLKMMKRAILATMAMRAAQYGLEVPQDPEIPVTDYIGDGEVIDLAGRVAFMSLPHQYTAQGGPTQPQLIAAHGVAQEALRGDAAAMELFQATNWPERFDLLLRKRFKPTIQAKICADFLRDDSLEADMTAWAVAQLMLRPQIAEVLNASEIDKLAARYKKVPQRLESEVPLEVSPELDQHFKEFQLVEELIAQADQKERTRIACAWALAKGEGSPAQIMRLYDEAHDQLQQVVQTLAPLALEWGVEVGPSLTQAT